MAITKTKKMSSLNLKQIQQLVDDLAWLKANYKTLTAAEKPEPPERPLKVDNEQDWNDYQRALTNWETALNNLDIALNDADAAIAKHCHKMLAWIPANIWIKTRDCYVGYQTDSWPGYEPRIQTLALDAELPKLQHHHTHD